jgi:hypothetical protein
MNRYIEDLKATAEQMTDLAKKLDGQKAQPMTKYEKDLVRLAVAPRVRGILDEAYFTFLAGNNLQDEPFLRDLRQISEDLNT